MFSIYSHFIKEFVVKLHWPLTSRFGCHCAGLSACPKSCLVTQHRTLGSRGNQAGRDLWRSPCLTSLWAGSFSPKGREFSFHPTLFISSHPLPATLCCREHIWSSLEKFNCAMTCTRTDNLQQLDHKLCLLQEPKRTVQWEVSGSCAFPEDSLDAAKEAQR